LADFFLRSIFDIVQLPPQFFEAVPVLLLSFLGLISEGFDGCIELLVKVLVDYLYVLIPLLNVGLRDRIWVLLG
jgi:hypothetical protein